MIKKCIVVGIWLFSSVVNIFAQNMPTPLDDLAYVIEQEKDENRVQQALQDFQQETGVAFILATVYKDHPYAVSVQEYHQHWLQTQQKGISLIIAVNDHKAYVESHLQVTADLEAILTEAQTKQIIEQVMSPIFTGMPVPNDAYTRGLLAGIAAIKQALQEGTTPAAFITFEPGPEQQYGFDQQQHASQMQHYEQSMVSKQPYAVAWKSVATGKQDIVVATDKKNGTIAEDIRFVSSTSGNLTSSAAGENKVQLTLTGKAHQMTEAVEVYQGKEKEEILVGKLNVISYDALRKKLIVVPVNEAVAPDAYILQTNLNAIYNQATVNWEVMVEEKFTVEADIIQNIEAVPAGVLSNYPKKMKELIKVYRKAKGEEKETYYIFLINQKSDKLGYMPKKRQYGFAFTKNINQEQLTSTIAHELAHGTFRLEHTFETYPALTKGSTSNLMDYAGGTHLHKYQWDLIHDPVKMLGWFQEDEEGAMVGIKYDVEAVKELLKFIREANLKSKSEVDLTNFKKANPSPYQGKFKIDGTDFEISVVHGFYNGKHIINPKQNNADADDYEFGRKGSFKKYSFYGITHLNKSFTVLEITLPENQSEALEKYLLLKSIHAILNENRKLEPDEIKSLREEIEKMTDEEEKKSLYRELQKKVKYHNQRDNSNEDADYMCNLTSQAMCLEYLGITCPDSSMQFEDYLEDVRKDNNYGGRTASLTRKKIAEDLGVNQGAKEWPAMTRSYLEKLLGNLLDNGYGVMISCGGHLVRLQDITEDGIIVDDPYGKVDLIKRYKNGSDSYGDDANSENGTITKGEDNLWKWNDVENVKFKYVEWYYVN